MKEQDKPRLVQAAVERLLKADLEEALDSFKTCLGNDWFRDPDGASPTETKRNHDRFQLCKEAWVNSVKQAVSSGFQQLLAMRTADDVSVVVPWAADIVRSCIDTHSKPEAALMAVCMPGIPSVPGFPAVDHYLAPGVPANDLASLAALLSRSIYSHIEAISDQALIDAKSQSGSQNGSTHGKTRSIRYRSSLKKGILLALIERPDSTSLEVCRYIDQEGLAEAEGSDRTMVSAYGDPSRRAGIETAVSKVRREMREKGILQDSKSRH